jgi:16S rRNA (cytosine1402-N4)-methyltransferase
MMEHTPVMVSQVLTFLLHEHSKTILDGTLGAGGHAEAILDSRPAIRLIGIDRDPTALRLAESRLARFGDRVRLSLGVFSDLDAVLRGDGPVDGVLLDLGLSSVQLDDPVRGFSYSADGELDMRMSRSGMTAREWLERAEASEIATVLRRNGDVRRARRVAQAIRAAADAGDMRHTAELRAAVERALGAGASPAELSRVFQAIRIHVNDELHMLDRFLETVLGHVNPGGRIVIISYHSLEDRSVKSFFKLQSATCICPPDAPVCTCARSPALRVLTRRVVKPSEEEVAANVRARSARLRAAEVLSTGRER